MITFTFLSLILELELENRTYSCFTNGYFQRNRATLEPIFIYFIFDIYLAVKPHFHISLIEPPCL